MRYPLAGDLKTRIDVKRVTQTVNANGFPVKTETSLFSSPVRCHWKNAYGKEIYEAAQLKLGETATLTLRYTPRIDVRCIVYKTPDTNAWEIVSLSDLDDRHQWLEIKVKRTVKA